MAALIALLAESLNGTVVATCDTIQNVQAHILYDKLSQLISIFGECDLIFVQVDE